MLVPAMNIREIHSQLKMEYDKLSATSLIRLACEYDRERKKSKVSRESAYPREYPIKTKGKNTWIIFMQKKPAVGKYAGIPSIDVLGVVYYYSSKGLRVFYLGNNDMLIGFNGHFFTRYNERMHLHLTTPLDIVKTFFRKGVYTQTETVYKDGRESFIGFGVDGLQLGKFHHEEKFIEWKTFVSRDLTFKSQDKIEDKLLQQLKTHIETEVTLENTTLYEIEWVRNVYHTFAASRTA